MDAKRPRRSQDFPSTDEAKYDRQLRLWGSDAQELLESAHVCVIGSSALGAEVLKNLVLPGVGRFTLIDITGTAAAATASAADVASNFFVWAEDVAAGRARCDAVAARVLELNDRVIGTARRVASAEQLLSAPSYFRQFSIVVLTQCWDEALTLRLEGVLREAGVPLVVASCVGFWGWLRISAPDHCVHDTRRTPPIRDLRIADPFPALAAFASSPRFGAHPDDMSGLSPLDHSHVPFPVVLIKALRLWHKQEANGEREGRPPTVGEIRSIVRTQLMQSGEEENMVEALTNATKALPFSVYGKVLVDNVCGRVFEDGRADAPPPDSEFWLAAAALKAFHRATGRLPLPAERLPDMASYTSDYVELQAVYNAEAGRDKAEVSRLAGEVCERAGCPPLREAVVDAFCRKAAYLYIAKYPTMREEFESFSQALYCCNEGDSAAEFSRSIVVAMRIARAFFAAKGRLPERGDISDVRTINGEFEKKYGVSVDDGVLLELCRYGGAELHNIAAVVAGVVSQEVIKLVTHRFIPLENTFVYNGINSTGARFNVPFKMN